MAGSSSCSSANKRTRLLAKQRAAGVPGRAAGERHEVPVLVTRGVPARGADALEEVEVSKRVPGEAVSENPGL